MDHLPSRIIRPDFRIVRPGVHFSGYRGGGQLATSFSDTFNRASGELGPNWAAHGISLTPYNNNVFAPTFKIGQATDLSQALELGVTQNAGTGTQIWGFCFPLPLCNSLVFGKTQFAQFTFKDYTSPNNSNVDLGVSGRPGAMPMGYRLSMNLHVASISVSKLAINGNGGQGTSLNSSTLVPGPLNGGATVNGDIWRISVDYTSVPGSAVVRISLNGVVISTTTDGTPVTGGYPHIGSVPGTLTAHVSNFSAGIGT